MEQPFVVLTIGTMHSFFFSFSVSGPKRSHIHSFDIVVRELVVRDGSLARPQIYSAASLWNNGSELIQLTIERTIPLITLIWSYNLLASPCVRLLRIVGGLPLVSNASFLCSAIWISELSHETIIDIQGCAYDNQRVGMK
jgi:hypothetical protein